MLKQSKKSIPEVTYDFYRPLACKQTCGRYHLISFSRFTLFIGKHQSASDWKLY